MSAATAGPSGTASGGAGGDGFVLTRTYDLYITYDQYYQARAEQGRGLVL